MNAIDAVTLADHMGTEELPIEWWEYAIMGVVGLFLLVALVALVAVVCYALENP